jgi:YVTN family beta-propeller protein
MAVGPDRSSALRPRWIAVLALALAACGGGGVDTEPSKALESPEGRKRALNLPPGATIPPDAHLRGMFGPQKPFPIIPVHAVLTADGRVLSYGTDGIGTQTAYFGYAVWDPATDTHLTLPNGTGTDIFCSSQILLPAGDRVLIAGGDNWTGTRTTNTGNNNSTLFTSADNTLVRQGNMNRARWYSTSTMLLSGEIYIQGGTGGTDRPEIRAENGTFRLLSGANTSGLDFMYPRNFVAPDGRIFGYDSAGRMYWVDPAAAGGSGSVTTAGQFGAATAGNDASAAMFAPGRILQFGGNSSGAIVIDINGQAPVVTNTAPMAMQRRLGNATLLADGKVLATGGSSVWNAMTNVVYDAEIWNPATGAWTRGATAQRARLYHSIALLLPDATVLVGGGGAPGPERNLNAEIYYPPYLFNAGGTLAERPVLSNAPSVVSPGRTVAIEVAHSRPIARVTLVKTGSVTHSWNMEQRFVDLPFNVRDGAVSVQIPGRASDVPPGMWMMFVHDDAGVPSVARMMRVNVAPTLNTAVTPLISSPGNLSWNVGTAVDQAITASDPNGDPLRYSASGLPQGLAIDPASGRITGTPTSAGSFSPTIAVSDGVNSASVTFNVTVNGTGTPLALLPPPALLPSQSGSGVTFSASAAGANVRYRWDFGDGTVSDWSSSGLATHSYASPGIYFVTVTATDDSGTLQSRTLMHQVFLPGTAGAPVHSANMLHEPTAGGGRIWVVNQDNDSVSVFDATTRARLAEIAVGSAPRALALAPDGSVWVTNKGSASISVIAASSLTVTRTIALPRGTQPFGIVAARARGSMLVALEGTGQLVRLGGASFAVENTLEVGASARHLAVAADGRTAYVARFITPPLPGEGTALVRTAEGGGQVVVVDVDAMTLTRTILLRHSDVPDGENQGRGIPNYLGAPVISPDGTQAFVPSKMDNVARGTLRDGLALNFQNTVRAISSRVVLASQQEDLGARIDHDNASLASAAAFDPLGTYLFVALETSREVAVLDAHRRNQLLRIPVGRAPQGLVVSPDRRTLYVHNFMDRTIEAFDLRPLTEQARADVTPLGSSATVGVERLTAQVLRGKQLFYDALDPRLARDRYMSCASCHNDGAADGRVWDLRAQGEGLRNTISLRGRSTAHGRLHWSGNFDEVQDFEGQIRTLAGGTGLMSDAAYFTGTRSQPLGDAKAGQSVDLDALAAYVRSLDAFDAAPARPSATALSAAAQDGRAVFVEKNCASCHGGPAFARTASGPLVDVGTIRATSGARLGEPLTGIDVPTLRDAWATAPYLHDGSAPTLHDAIRAHANVAITQAEITRVVAYLREIGRDETAAPHASGGLTARYFANITLSGNPVLTRTEGVNFNWGTGSPGAGVPVNSFSVRWTGRVVMPTTGTYRFQTESDDGVRLWINGQLVVNNWTDHSRTTDTGAAMAFTAGQQADVVMEYYERNGSAVARLRWLTPGATGYVAVPTSQLMPAPAGLQAQYFAGTDATGSPLLTRLEAVDFDWAAAAPDVTVPADGFSARWSGSIVVPASGVYRLRTLSDDGVRLTIAGIRRIDNWTDHALTTDTTADLPLVAGQRVPIVLEYYDRTGLATMRLQWQTPGSTAWVAVPPIVLTPP